MKKVGEMYQRADWKKEKYVPVTDCPDKVKGDGLFDVTASLRIREPGRLIAPCS